jgi:hypothetical protein
MPYDYSPRSCTYCIDQCNWILLAATTPMMMMIFCGLRLLSLSPMVCSTLSLDGMTKTVLGLRSITTATDPIDRSIEMVEWGVGSDTAVGTAVNSPSYLSM